MKCRNGFTSNLKQNKETWNIINTNCSVFFMIHDTWNISDIYGRVEWISRYVFLFETFESKPPFICNHNQTIKQYQRKKTFCQGMKWMCKRFEIDGQWVLKSSKHFVLDVAQGNSHQFYLASFWVSGIFCFFLLSYNGNNSLESF